MDEKTVWIKKYYCREGSKNGRNELRTQRSPAGLWLPFSARFAKYLSGRITRLLRSKQHVQGTEFRRLAGPPQGRPLSERTNCIGRLAAAGLQRRPKWTGRHSVHAYPVPGNLLCK